MLSKYAKGDTMILYNIVHEYGSSALDFITTKCTNQRNSTNEAYKDI